MSKFTLEEVLGASEIVILHDWDDKMSHQYDGEEESTRVQLYSDDDKKLAWFDYKQTVEVERNGFWAVDETGYKWFFQTYKAINLNDTVV